MHHDEDDAGAKHDEPKAFSRFVGFQHGQQDGGDEADGLHVGDEVQESDEHAQGNGQREVDDEEADAEQDAHQEGHKGLPAEIGIHAALHVVNQRCGETAAALGDELDPFSVDFFVIQ